MEKNDNTPPPATKPKGKAAPAKMTVDAWGKLKFPPDKIGKLTRPTFDRWKHGAAAALHGWRQHAHHAGAPMELSEPDYDAALEAAQKAECIPHKPALSEHADRMIGR